MTISRETFDAWRVPRVGTENPTRLDNPLWTSLVHDRINAWAVNKRFGYERQRGAGPTWCFDRFGQSATTLADGRTIYIAGEHEDHYDPDFYIYNDVVIVAPDGSVEIYGYPREVFPPTDFHSATLDGDRIWIVGNLGYPGARDGATTQVCRLDLRTLAIEQLATAGESPGWLHKHEAQLGDGAIVVRGGLVDRPTTLEENIDDWALDLQTLTWSRRTARDWQRWAVQRADGVRGMLWEVRQLKWHLDHPDFVGGVDYRAGLAGVIHDELDFARLDDLYLCEGATALEQREDEYNVWRISLDGVIVRFTEESFRIVAIVEGKLAEARLRALQQHVLAGLSALYCVAWELET